MQILRLTIQNIRAVDGDGVELDFASPDGQPRRRTVLLAANGFGKTTTLDAIAHWFGAFDERMGARALGAGDIQRAAASTAPAPGAPPPRGVVEVEAALSSEERAAIRAYYPKAAASGSIRREIDAPMPPAPSEWRWRAGGPGLDELVRYMAAHGMGNVEDDTFASAARAAVFATRGAPCVYLTADRGALTAPSDVSAADLADFDPRAASLAPGRDRFRALAAHLALAWAAPKDNDRDGLVRRLWRVLEEHLPRMPRPVGVRGLTLLFDNARGAQVGLSELSDGERAVLLLLGEIALRNPQHGVVLIDELEQHLHPRWQRDILDALVALVPTAQFIITTQSVSLAAAAPDDLVKLGDWDEHGA